MSVSPRTPTVIATRTRTAFALALLVFFCALSLNTQVRAEPRAVDLARESYVQGIEAAKNERWFDAVEHFRHSYELSHTTAALYNLGVALRALGRHREARDTFSVLLEGAGKLDQATRENAEKLLRDAGQRVVPLRIAGFDPAGAYEVVVDGVPNAVSGETELTLEVDEGRHALSVQRGARSVLRWTGAVQAGSPLSLELAAPPPEEPMRTVEPVVPAPRTVPLQSTERDPHAPSRSKVWWWVGGGTVLAAAAAVATVFLVRSRAPASETADAPEGVPLVNLR
jgi:hypothetical protein